MEWEQMKYACVRQHDYTDCAAACLATICKQDKKTVSIAGIREIAGTDKMGTNIKGLIHAAGKLGYKAKGYRGSKEVLTSDLETPCIAHMLVDEGLLHFVVIHRIKDGKILIADPAAGLVHLTIDEFLGLKKPSKGRHTYKWSGIVVLLEKTDETVTITRTKGGIRRALEILYAHKGILAAVFLASVLFSVAGIISSFFLKEILDNILPNALERMLATVSISVILLNIFRVLLNAFRRHLLISLGRKVDTALIFGYFKHVLKLPMTFFDSRRIGEIVSRFSDAGKVRDAVIGATVTIMVDTLMAAAGAVVLYLQDAKLFFITLAVAFVYALIALCYNGLFRRLNEEVMENNSKLTSHMVEALNGILTVKAYRTEKNVIDKGEERFEEFVSSLCKMNYSINAQDALKSATELVGTSVIIWVGAMSVIRGEISIGTVLAFSSLMSFFMEPLKSIINLQPQVQTAMVAADRLNEVMELDEEGKKDADKAFPADNSISVKDVHFSYGFRKEVISGISANIASGEHVAFVGDSGSGKTTIAKLLLGFYEAKGGTIEIGGTNISDISKSTLRENVVYIPQDTFLFRGTVTENIAIGCEHATQEDVVAAAKIAMAHDFIEDMPLGYDTLIEENGSNLSGGQKQRLAIARAIVKKPRILILDEATSNLDALTEKTLTESLDSFARDITVIIIAHRLSLIRNCDRIYVFENGKITEAGTHDELCAAEGKYAELARIQYLN